MDKDKKVSRRVVLRGAVVAAGAVPILLSGITAAHAKVKQKTFTTSRSPKTGSIAQNVPTSRLPKAASL